MAAGNTRLVQYGIQTDESDLRAHVCIIARAIYVYPTASGRACIASGLYQERAVFTNRIKTASGYIVPVNVISGIHRVDLTNELDMFPIAEDDAANRKGAQAQAIVARMAADWQFPAPLDIQAITDTRRQVAGIDIVLRANLGIQVKCDYNGGEVARGGTGNLFLQTAECNPLGSH